MHRLLVGDELSDIVIQTAVCPDSLLVSNIYAVQQICIPILF
jgi:hypothetical protein